LCCYIGDCNGLDIAVVCPQLSVNLPLKQTALIYPNPGQDVISVQADFESNVPVAVRVSNAIGQLVYEKTNMMPSDGKTILLEALNCKAGIYFVQVQQSENTFNAYWVRQ